MSWFIIAIVVLMLGAAVSDLLASQYIRALYWFCGATLNFLVGLMKG